MMLVAFGGISSGMVELSISVQLAAEGKIKVAPGPEPKGVCLAWLRCFWLRWISKVSISVGSDMETLLCMILVNGWCGLYGFTVGCSLIMKELYSFLGGIGSELF